MDLTGWGQVLQQFGAAGLICALVWKLADKWLGQFLAASKDQTAAMSQQATAIASLVETVKAGQSDQHEVLLAVRVQSRTLEELRKLVETKLATTGNG